MKQKVNEVNGLQEYLKTIGQYNTYTLEEEQKAFQSLAAGDPLAREDITNHNLKLVVAIAKKYKGKSALSFVDLIQEGSLGLMAAIDKFDYTLGYKFSTYATYWIKQAIVRAIVDKGRAIRLPAHINDKLLKVKKVERELTSELGYSPSNEEIGNKLDISAQEVQDIYDMSMNTLSLDTPVSDDEEVVMSDMIEDTHFTSPTENVAQIDLKEQIMKVLDSLEPREKEVIIRRYGLIDDEPLTLEEVGDLLGLSRERIRQIEEKALRKLRNPIRSSQLKAYMAEMVA